MERGIQTSQPLREHAQAWQEVTGVYKPTGGLRPRGASFAWVPKRPF